MKTYLRNLFLCGLLWTPSPLARAAGSLYDLPVSFENQNAETVGWKDFVGRPVIVSMFYTSCDYTCPFIIQQIKKIEESLAPTDLRRIKILLISFDSDRDQPEKLRRVLTRHGLSDDRWQLVRTTPDKVRELAALLKIQYRKLPSGGFNHSSVISLLDRDGRNVAGIGGVASNEELLQALRAMLER